MRELIRNEEDILEMTMNRLAEVALETPEAELTGEAALAGGTEVIEDCARRVRSLLWTTAKAHKQRPLFEALTQYRSEVEAVRARAFELPESPAARRELLTTLFREQMPAYTVQHRDFKTMSDADVESFLKQLQALGALPAKKA